MIREAKANGAAHQNAINERCPEVGIKLRGIFSFV